MSGAPARLAAAAAALALLALAGAPRSASAQPVSFQLKNDVPSGSKPSITLVAVEKVADLRVTLERDDGLRVELKHPQLNPRQQVTLPFGDGKPGKAHWTGKLSLTIVGVEPWSYDIAFDTLVRASIQLGYDIDHLDLPGRTLRFTMSRPAGHAEITVVGDDGQEMGHGEATYNKEPPGTWLPITWTEAAGEAAGKLRTARVMVLRLSAASADGLRAATELSPWSVQVEHEDVTFDTDSAVIRPDEVGKLDKSLERIREIAKGAERYLQVKLYVAGHTDTVGSKEHNRQLSLDRARAIAEYFRKRGLAIPVSYEGFGEEVQAVVTPDGTDEPRNRRVDYVLGAASAQPPFSGSYRAVRSEWRTLK